MRRKKQHLTVINRLLRDERMVPRLAGVFQLLAMVEDAETPEEKDFYKSVIFMVYGSDPKRIRWSDPEDPPSDETHLTRRDAAATETARDFLAKLSKPKGEPSA